MHAETYSFVEILVSKHKTKVLNISIIYNLDERGKWQTGWNSTQ